MLASLFSLLGDLPTDVVLTLSEKTMYAAIFVL